jgi:YbbR domain-containing protein
MSEASLSPLRVIADLAFRNWGTKLIALLLAGVVFVMTRDEVSRAFEVPLRIEPDPDRVLMTDLPESIQVQVRGPWTRVNRLQDYDFGTATLDLRSASPGPLEIDRASIVMPSGVILAGIQYDHVDLRFDKVIERDISIATDTVGAPDADYELSRVEVTPERWAVRGGASFVQRVQRLQTEPLEITGATQDVIAELPIVAPATGTHLVGEDAKGVRVKVRAVIEPKAESRTYSIPVIVPEGIDRAGVIPRTYEVEVAGPLPEFRTLEGLGISFPVEASAEVVEGTPAAGGVAEVRFSWGDSVPTDVRARLKIDHGVERITLPAPAPPTAPLDGEDTDG